MENVQKFINIPLVITEENFVRNRDTGFFCLKLNGTEKCLHKGFTRSRSSSGTITSKIPDTSKKMLDDFYKQYESDLLKITEKKFMWLN